MGGDPGRDEQPRPRTWLGRTQAATLDRIEYWRHSYLLRRLQAADVINQGLLLAAVLLLCFLPFLLVIESVSGRSDAAGFIRRFGLSREAEHAVRLALTAPAAPSTAFTGLSWVFFVLFGIAAAGAIQDLYGSVFDVKGRLLRDLPRRVVWLAAALGVSFAGAWTQPWLDRVGGPGLVAIAALVGATAFWWFSMWLLLDGRLGWRELFPSALATGICWLGMVIFFRLTLSSSIVSSYTKYGSVGVVFAIMPLLIAMGVVIILGALLGVAWRERHEHPLGEQPDSSTEPGRLQLRQECRQQRPSHEPLPPRVDVPVIASTAQATGLGPAGLFWEKVSPDVFAQANAHSTRSVTGGLPGPTGSVSVAITGPVTYLRCHWIVRVCTVTVIPVFTCRWTSNTSRGSSFSPGPRRLQATD